MAVRANAAAGESRVRRATANLAAWQIATTFVLLGVGLLYVAEAAKGRREPAPWDAVVRDLGSLFIATGALSVLWEMIGRRALTDEVLAAADLSSEVQSARLRRVAGRYLD